MDRIVLAYSGGLVSSVAIPWLTRQYQAEVVTLTLDFGQERELAAVRERALALGAVRAHVVDVREEFVRDYLLPALQAGALKDGASLVRPLIAKRLVEIGLMETASAVAHGGEPGTQGEAALHDATASLETALTVISPARGWNMSFDELRSFARARGVHLPSSPRFRTDTSLWGGVVRANVGQTLSDDAFSLTRSREECPDDPALVDIEFSAGVPVRANGVEMCMLELIESLETIAGAHGVGRSHTGDMVSEAPAAVVLDVAHRELESLVLGPDLSRTKAQLAGTYSEAIDRGQWFGDIRQSIQAFAQGLQPRVTGMVRLKLLKGQCMVVHCQSAGAAWMPATSERRSKVVA